MENNTGGNGHSSLSNLLIGSIFQLIKTSILTSFHYAVIGNSRTTPSIHWRSCMKRYRIKEQSRFLLSSSFLQSEKYGQHFASFKYQTLSILAHNKSFQFLDNFCMTCKSFRLNAAHVW